MNEKKRGSRSVNTPLCIVCLAYVWYGVRLSASVAFLVSSAGFKHLICKPLCPNQGLLTWNLTHYEQVKPPSSSGAMSVSTAVSLARGATNWVCHLMLRQITLKTKSDFLMMSNRKRWDVHVDIEATWNGFICSGAVRWACSGYTKSQFSLECFPQMSSCVCSSSINTETGLQGASSQLQMILSSQRRRVGYLTAPICSIENRLRRNTRTIYAPYIVKHSSICFRLRQ